MTRQETLTGPARTARLLAGIQLTRPRACTRLRHAQARSCCHSVRRKPCDQISTCHCL